MNFNKILLFITLLLLLTYGSFAQKDSSAKKQELGINLAGLLIKDQNTVIPGIQYRYKILGGQLRLQFGINSILDNNSRTGNFDNFSVFGGFNVDTVLDFDPGKTIKLGFMAGYQKNIHSDLKAISYFYGIDLMYFLNELSRNGSGIAKQGNGGFDTTKQRIQLKVSESFKQQIMGIAIPLGISYNFYKNFFLNLESRIVFTVDKTNKNKSTETLQISQGTTFETKTNSKDTLKAFNFGILPLTALTIGVVF
ncbi:MAG: hypothetical protein H6605_09065 [Flavobacteriales bacterium]|nr:hypothetical protein [Flavobacteriales bacterium]